MYDVIFSDNAFRQLEKLDKGVQERIIKTLERIRLRPEAYVTRLIGEEGYKLRIGDYRAILDLEEDKLLILIIKVGHRKNIHK
jgi:mRNA interferase RelE/StbE